MAKPYVEAFARDLSFRRRHRRKVMLRRMRMWAQTLGGKWPQMDPQDSGFANWKTPVARSLIHSASEHARRRYIDLVLQAAVAMRDSRPEQAHASRISAIIEYPNLFDSEVCVFFDDACFRTFADRNTVYEHWTPLPPSRSLLRRYRLRLPDGFTEQGYDATWRDDSFDPPYVHRREVWMINEVG